MIMKVLNKTQVAQVIKILGYYKSYFICNECGTVYGSDLIKQKTIQCPICEAKSKGNKDGKRN